MPLIQITLLEGRTEAQKAALIKAVTKAVVEAIGAPPESVRIALYELPRTHWAVGGVTKAELEARAQAADAVPGGAEGERADRLRAGAGEALPDADEALPARR
ncbi:2-hydroxymuconate tautomerase [Hydrogenibacillus schlegelii]|uniref:2-hydroxymuconate tautomerase n=1 Tax=Hydrogenibacillus schlegelii TaxID=1484 RepID=UPI0008267164|nr:2-hydroxymuconate tautomerase [Hydrogenibacillus schlegelii]